MNMICSWVRADDGALVMEWTAAEATAVHRGTGGSEAAYAIESFYDNADALTPEGALQGTLDCTERPSNESPALWRPGPAGSRGPPGRRCRGRIPPGAAPAVSTACHAPSSGFPRMN